MPIYEYECQKCKKHHELMQKITDKPCAQCPDCGGKMKKLISNTSFVLKGTGWYATDYASDKKKRGGAEQKAKKHSEPKTEKKEEPKGAEKAEVKEAAVSK
jgi:putative FmdB family regulatory protein